MSFLRFWDWQIGARHYVNRFDAGEMSKSTIFWFFLVNVFLWSVAAELGFWEHIENSNGYDVLISLVTIVSITLGTWYLYSKHTEATSFVEKYMVVGLVTIPVLIVYFVLAGFLAGLVAEFVFPAWLESTTASAVDVGLVLATFVIMYLKLGTYFK